jgi:repressor LexA
MAPSQSASLTEIERRILDYMVSYLRSNTYQPSIREIGRRFGIKSTKTVSEHLQALADKGFLERDPSRSRGVKILGIDLNAQTVSVPCYGRVPLAPHERRAELVEMHLTLDRRIAGAKGSFFVRAQAGELAALGVQEGDFVLVEPVDISLIQDGATVVYTQDGKAEFARFNRNGRGFELRSARLADADPVHLDPREHELVGRVSILFRRMDRLPTSSLTAH